MLTPEDLVHHHPGDVFLHERIDACDLETNLPVGLSRFLPEEEGPVEKERQHAQRDESQRPVHGEHEVQDTDDGEDIAEHHHYAGGEHFVQDFHVVCHPGNQAANRVSVVERQSKPLQVGKDLHPEIEDRSLPDPLRQVGIQVLQEASEHKNAEEQQRGPEKARHVMLRDVLIDRDLGEIGAYRLHPGHRDAQENAESHPTRVRPEIVQHPAHEPRIVGLTEDFFFLHAYSCSNSSSSSCFRWSSA